MLVLVISQTYTSALFVINFRLYIILAVVRITVHGVITHINQLKGIYFPKVREIVEIISCQTNDAIPVMCVPMGHSYFQSIGKVIRGKYEITRFSRFNLESGGFLNNEL